MTKKLMHLVGTRILTVNDIVIHFRNITSSSLCISSSV